MKQKDTTATPATDDKPAVIVRVKVLKNGLTIAGGIAAKGTVVSVTEAAAKFHEDRGEASIVGTL